MTNSNNKPSSAEEQTKAKVTQKKTPRKRTSKSKADSINQINTLLKKFDVAVSHLLKGTSSQQKELETLHQSLRHATSEKQNIKMLGQALSNEICRFADLGRTVMHASFRQNEKGKEKLKNAPEYIAVSRGYEGWVAMQPKENKISQKDFLEGFEVVNFDLVAYERAKQHCELSIKAIEKGAKKPQVRKKKV